jgi:ABC-type amino acid transport substrate-binding protein
MLRFQIPLIMIWAAVALGASSVSAVAQSQCGKAAIRLATHDLPPYQMIEFDEDNKPALKGLAVDMVTCALDKMKINYEITLTDAKAGTLGTQTGVYHGNFVASANKARAKYSKPSVPIIFENLKWYLRKGSKIDPNDPADRLNARYSAKFTTSKWIHLMSEGYNVVMRPQKADSLLNMLLTGDIDVGLEYESIFEHYIEARGLSVDQFEKIAFKSKNMTAHFSDEYLNDHPSFLSLFDENVLNCTADLR